MPMDFIQGLLVAYEYTALWAIYLFVGYHVVVKIIDIISTKTTQREIWDARKEAHDVYERIHNAYGKIRSSLGKTHGGYMRPYTVRDKRRALHEASVSRQEQHNQTQDTCQETRGHHVKVHR